MNHLESIKQYTTIVADTGDFESMRAYQPQDATTNPSLILKAITQDAYRPLFDEAVRKARQTGLTGEALNREAMLETLVNFGCQILEIVPGRVSTEVDARLSFDVEGSVEMARTIIAKYAERGIGRERILIKLASSWEGVRAAEILQKEGIRCNMTLMFSLIQAVACAEAGATLISPFVGRILDWFKANQPDGDYAGPNDPGVKSVREIYGYYKHYGYPTEVMGASFRNVGEILELAGCDLLTISPNLLQELADAEGTVAQRLNADTPVAPAGRLPCDEKTFRWLMNEDAMATDKLADGIRRFAADIVKLEALIDQVS